MKYKSVVTLLFLTGLLFIASTKMAYAVTIPYADVTLSTPMQMTHWNDVWDLTQGDLTLSYTIDMTGLYQPGTWQTYDGSTLYAEVGLRGEGAADFNPGPFNVYQGNCGGWMTGDDDTWNDGDGLTEHGAPKDSTQDLDDTFGLAASGGRGSRDYDVLLSAPDIVGPTKPDPWNPADVIGAYGSHDNYGFWFDRDGVDPWQDEYPLTPGPGPSGVMWGAVDGSTYNTAGIYDIVITYHSINPGLGVMFATVNGIQQGCYSAGWKNAQPEYYPVGLSFKGDMKHMQVFAGVWGPNNNDWGQLTKYGLTYFDYGHVHLSNISVSGVLGTSDPLDPGFTYSFPYPSPPYTVHFTDTTHGGMPPYSYSWDFGDGTPVSTVQNPTHTYAGPGSYIVKLTVTPYRCVTKSTDPIVIFLKTPVGGEWVPINTLQMLVPLVGSIVAMSAIVASFVGFKRIKKRQN